MRYRTPHAIVLILLLSINVVSASPAEQTVPAGLRGPVIGYVLDHAIKQIRPINGILGSSVLGEPLSLPFSVATAAFSPRGDFALTISASDTSTAYVLEHLGDTNTVAAIDGIIPSVDRVIFNAEATAAALLATGNHQLQFLSGLPSSPTAGPSVDLSSIDGTITAVAMDGTGTKILIGASAEHGALYLVTDEQNSPRLIASFGSPAALALQNGDQDVIVADAAISELSLIRNFASVPELFRIAGERDGIADPAGLRITSDGRKLYIANRSSQTLDVWNFQQQSIEATFPLDAEPTQLMPLQGSATFLLNDAGDHPLLLLDAVNLAVYFVPAKGDRN